MASRAEVRPYSLARRGARRRADHRRPRSTRVDVGIPSASDAASHRLIVSRADEPHLVASTVAGAANLAFNTWRPAAVLIGQRVLGAKNFKELARK